MKKNKIENKKSAVLNKKDRQELLEILSNPYTDGRHGFLEICTDPQKREDWFNQHSQAGKWGEVQAILSMVEESHQLNEVLKKIKDDIEASLTLPKVQSFSNSAHGSPSIEGAPNYYFADVQSFEDSDHNSHSEYQPSLKSSSSVHASDTDEPIEQSTAKVNTRSAYIIQDKPIRGEVLTYAKDTVGGIKFHAKDGKTFITPDSVIRRPINVTGNLGRQAGDHLISFSLFTKYIESIVKNKELYQAISDLRDTVAGFYDHHDIENQQDSYQAIIEKAKEHQPIIDNGDARINAGEFLRTEFIPGVIAIWNQQLLTAFKSHKNTTEFLNEAREVKKVLASKTDNHEERVKNFMNVVDYKPIQSAGEISEDSIRSMLEQGERTNDVNTLAFVMCKIIETYHIIYAVDESKSEEINETIILEFFEKNKWVEHYEDNHADLGDLKTIPLGATKETIRQELVKFISQEMKKSYPHLVSCGDITPQIDDGSISSHNSNEDREPNRNLGNSSSDPQSDKTSMKRKRAEEPELQAATEDREPNTNLGSSSSDPQSDNTSQNQVKRPKINVTTYMQSNSRSTNHDIQSPIAPQNLGHQRRITRNHNIK